MAVVEFNALSVILCGSFSMKVFLPEMDKLYLDDRQHEKKYPVLWLLHDEGGTALDWMHTQAEKYAVEKGIFIIAPDVQHTLCTDMVYGPKYEQYMRTELPKICRNMFPISADPGQNWIGGVGTGGYGALKMALKYPDVFSRGVALDGVLDLGVICNKALNGEQTGIHHTRASLEAVFGDLNCFSGSRNDLVTLAAEPTQSRFFLAGAKNSVYRAEWETITQKLGGQATLMECEGNPDNSCAQTLQAAVQWVCGSDTVE